MIFNKLGCSKTILFDAVMTTKVNANNFVNIYVSLLFRMEKYIDNIKARPRRTKKCVHSVHQMFTL